MSEILNSTVAPLREAAESSGAAPAPSSIMEPQPLLLRRLAPALIVMLLALVMVIFTNHTYHFLYGLARCFPDDYVTSTKQFVSTCAVTTLVLIVWIFDRRRRAAVVTMLLALALAGGINGLLKFAAGRARPAYGVRLNEGDKESRKRLKEYLKEHPETQIHLDGHDFWLIMTKNRPYIGDGSDIFNSFPSGHTCAAFALAAFLVMLYPSGRLLWLLLAVGCGLARIAQRRHYPEDVLFGGALGWILAQWVLSWRWPYALGERISALDRKFFPAPRDGGAEDDPARR